MLKIILYNFVVLVGFCFVHNLLMAQGRIIIKNENIAKSEKEAILVLPGFGSKIFGTKSIFREFKDSGYDIFIPKYISRKSIECSVRNLESFMLKHELKKYKKLHVFSYIFGSWTINNWISKNGKNNIKTIVYDRSPLQERAPAVLLKDSPLLARILFGKVMKDFCDSKYLPVSDTSISVGILIETFSTKLIYKHRETAMQFGEFRFSPENFNQNYVDFCFVPLNHDEMYKDLEVFGPDVIHFIKNSVFTNTIKSNRVPKDPFSKFKKQ